MKKILVIALVLTAILSLSALASEAVVSNTSYCTTNNSGFEVSFDVDTDVSAVALVSSYNKDGRLLEYRIVPVASNDTYTAEFSDYKVIDHVKINVLENTSTLVPLCVQNVVNNGIRNGDNDIWVAPLF